MHQTISTNEVASELLATGGVISPTGYTGPLFAIRWLTEPPVNARGLGDFVLTPEAASGLTEQISNFTGYYKPQTLTITRQGAQVVLSWSLEASSMVLETSDFLEGESEWTVVDSPVIQVNGQNTVTLDAVGPHKFFRLNSPY